MIDLAPIAIVAASGLVLYGARRVARAFRAGWHVRRERLVTCPETGAPAAVHIDATRAALAELRADEPPLRLSSCSRWPERGPCDEACLFEAVAPASRVDTIAEHWFAGKTCVLCRGPVLEDRVAGHHAALLDASGITREWSVVPAAALPAALAAGSPVCWNCHVAETFRRTYPQLVTDRDGVPRAS
jgi:hypothetical protein